MQGRSSFAATGAQAQWTMVDPCDLLTAQEVSQVIGVAVEAGDKTNNGITEDGAVSTTCVWIGKADAATPFEPKLPMGGRAFAILNVMAWPGGPNAANKFLESFQKAFEDKDIPSEPVPVSVGADNAIWWGDGIAARKNSISFGVSVAQAGDRATRKPKAEALAKLIASRVAKL